LLSVGVFEDRVEHLPQGRMDVQFISRTCNDCDAVFRAAYYECTAGCPHKDYHETRELFAVCARCYETTEHDIQHLEKKPVHHPFTAAVVAKLCKCPGIENPLRVVVDFPDPENWEQLFDERQKQKLTLEGHNSKCQFLAMESKRLQVVHTVNKIEDKKWEDEIRTKLEAQKKKYRFRSDKEFLKKFPKLAKSKVFPVGNAHVSLMVGPLIIENGAEP